MAGEDKVKLLAIEQRKRLVASLLTYCEKAPWWRHLDTSQKEALRGHVITVVGVYHDFMLDVIKIDITAGPSEEMLALLQGMSRSLSRIDARTAEPLEIQAEGVPAQFPPTRVHSTR